MSPLLLKIRRFDPSDRDEVLRLHIEGLRTTGADAGVGPWDDDLKQIDESYVLSGGDFLVGTVDGKVVAMGALRRLSQQVAEVKRMRVTADFQRRGFGEQILHELERRARALGFSRIQLDTTTLQRPAQELYRKNGYSKFKRENVQGLELIFFEKLLGA
jgi:GNAT superfamily N-acetyltransferase